MISDERLKEIIGEERFAVLQAIEKRRRLLEELEQRSRSDLERAVRKARKRASVPLSKLTK